MKAIMYHYIRPDDALFPHFKHLHIDDFRKQLDYFESEFGICSKAEFCAALDSGHVSSNKVILTFDDGFSDHYHYVLPELKKRNLWGIFYISTGVYSGISFLDTHKLHLILGHHGGEKAWTLLQEVISEDDLSEEFVEKYKSTSYPLQQSDIHTKNVKKTLNYFVKPSRKSMIIQALFEKSFPQNPPQNRSFYLTQDQIKALFDAEMTIGSHTVSHTVMSRLNFDDQFKEIDDSFNFLNSIVDLNRDYRTFCYPFGGKHTYNEDTQRALKQVNCRYAFSVENGDIGSYDFQHNLLTLPRYDCNMFPHGQCRD